MDDHYYAVILAGGGGTRLWPYSRKSRPKQTLKIWGERTLFQQAVDRLQGIFPYERILIVTTISMVGKLQTQVPQIQRKNYILEPEPRGTAPAIGLAAVALRARDKDPHCTMLVLTADHLIRNVPYFRNVMEAGVDIARAGYLVTLGIQPTYPATAYGYIQQGEWIGGFLGFKVFRVVRFREKPDQNQAKAFIRAGDHLWNSGMFVWRADHIMHKFSEFMPELASGLFKIEEVWDQPQKTEVLESIWSGIKPETIDYGIMEKATDVAVLPVVNLGWNDVGSWDSLFDVLPLDDDGNIVVNAQYFGYDTKNSLIWAEKSSRPIVTLGARNLIIVDTGDVLFVCPREEAHNIKKLIEFLISKEMDRFL